jgi:putative transposase
MIWTSVMELRAGDHVELYAACLMPDHLHLLIAPKERDVIAFVGAWKSWTTRRAWDFGIRNSLWQRRMWDRTVRNDDDFAEVAEYIVCNPVVAGLVEMERDWLHSWVWWWED